MGAMDRTFNDRFWPVFVGCLAIGIAELAAVACVCLGREELAGDLNSYWLWGSLLSLWLWPRVESSADGKAGGILSRTPANTSLLGWLVICGILSVVAIVYWAESFFPAPWPVVVQGAAVGPYLVMVCWIAWKADVTTDQAGSADGV